MKRIVCLFFVFCAFSGFLSGCGNRDVLLIPETDIPAENGTDGGTGDNGDFRETESVSGGQEPLTESTLMVHVCGAVNAPGVYSLTEPARVYQAIEMAGGLTETADRDYLNQARYLIDGEQIYVPETGEFPESGERYAADSCSAETGGLVNLNAATLEELMSLPGIGEVKANNILQYRQEHGSYSSVEELLNVSGIGEATYAQLKDLVTV